MAKYSITFHVDDDVDASKFTNTLLQALNGYDDAVHVLRGMVRMIRRAVDPVIEMGSYTISVDWCVEDVQEVRPDLSVEQCINVLDHVKKYHDANDGISWHTLDAAAEVLYPEHGSNDDRDDASAGAGS